MKYEMINNKYSGKIIVFTGVDGAGKTTLLRMAGSFLQEMMIDYMTTKMPSDRIRSLSEFRNFHDSHDAEKREAVDIFSLTVLACGDRLIVQDTDIIPNIRRGMWALCDRYCFTGNIRCDDPIITAITNRFIKPDLVVVADASEKIVKKRVMSRENERELFYDDQSVKEQMNAYRRIAQDNEFLVVNTEQEISAVEMNIRQAIRKLIPG